MRTDHDVSGAAERGSRAARSSCALFPRAALLALFSLVSSCDPPGTTPSAVAPGAPTSAAPVFAPVEEPPPTGRLPADVRPVHYTLALEIVPERERFAGSVEITVDLDRPRSVIWLHG